MRRFVWAAAALAALVGLGWFGVQRSGLTRPPTSVLLISVDTLRADRLGSYGYAAARTPHIDALAARGLRFSQATTVVPLTLPAHTSLMTATFPPFHGVRDNGGFYVDDAQTTLAEVLHAQGYRTGGFVGAFVLDRRWGIAQGFDHYVDDFDLSRFDMTAGLDAAQRPGREVVDAALAWLAQPDPAPFFAWVHLYDPHSPYAPPEPHRSQFPATLQGAYDGEVAEADTQIGRLVSALRDSGRLDSTLVVVVSDHGEALGEHGEQQHGFFIYDAVTQVPLIMAGPGIEARVVPEQVRIVDVMPTVLDALHLTGPSAMQGQSLLPLMRGDSLNLLAYSETYYPRYHYGWSELTSIRDGQYKFIAAPRRELYDVTADPHETQDLSAAQPQRADAMARAVRDLAQRLGAAQPTQAPRAVDPETARQLQALGYVAGTVTRAALEDRERGDPKDKISLYNLLKRAAQDSVGGHWDEGIRKVEQVLRDDPAVVEAHTMLGNMHVKAGRVPLAIRAYQQALALDPEHEGAAWSLALAYRDAGNEEAARSGFERVLQLNPRGARPLYQLAEAAVRRRDFREAVRLLTQGLTLDADRPAFLVKLAEAQLAQGDLDAAERALTEAIAARDTQAMAHYNMGLVHEARGRRDAAIEAYRREIAHSPALHQPHFNLARLLDAQGRAAEALAEYARAVEVSPTFGTGHVFLAKARFDAGDFSGAEQSARAGLAASPDPAIAPLGHFVLADLYARQGREADARREAAAGERLRQKARPRS